MTEMKLILTAIIFVMPGSQLSHVHPINDPGRNCVAVQTKAQQEVGRKSANVYMAEYYPNGQLAFIQHMKNGSIDGEVRAYYEDGTLKGIVDYVQNHQEGISREYYPDGDIKEEVLFVKGQMKDLKRFDTQGSLVFHQKDKFETDCLVVASDSKS